MKTRVIVEVSSGIACVYSDKPEEIEVLIVDYDTDGCEPEELSSVAYGELVILRREEASKDNFEEQWKMYEDATPFEDEEEDCIQGVHYGELEAFDVEEVD